MCTRLQASRTLEWVFGFVPPAKTRQPGERGASSYSVLERRWFYYRLNTTHRASRLTDCTDPDPSNSRVKRPFSPRLQDSVRAGTAAAREKRLPIALQVLQVPFAPTGIGVPLYMCVRPIQWGTLLTLSQNFAENTPKFRFVISQRTPPNFAKKFGKFRYFVRILERKRNRKIVRNFRYFASDRTRDC